MKKLISIVCYLFVAAAVFLYVCSSCAKQDTTKVEKVEEQQIIPEEEHFPCP